MYLKIEGYEINCAEGTTWAQAHALLPADRQIKNPLGVLVGGRAIGMYDPAEEYAHARILTLRDEEGRRIYERSLSLLYVTAVHTVCPKAHVRIEHSIGNGVYTEITGCEVNNEFVRAVDDEMRALVRRDLPVAIKHVGKDEAQAYFARTGQTDRLRVLNYRTFPHFTLFSIDAGPEDYYYGVMADTTGKLGAFSLTPCGDGIVLSRPDMDAIETVAPFKDVPKLRRIFHESAVWNEILACRNVSDLNEMIERGNFREFIRVNEALQACKIDKIAEQFVASGARLILIAGPSSSGKTTFANRLSIALRVHGLRPVKVSLDDYYIDLDKREREPDGTIDLERVDALDTALISEHLRTLIAGDTVEMPEYDFHVGKRKPETHPMRVEAGQPILIEGIHGLNEQLTYGIERSLKFKIYISALTVINLDDHNRIRTTDARLLRRIVRDNLFRGILPESTMRQWGSVRRGERKYIFPYQEEADAMFNTSMTYELPIMKKYAFPLLSMIGQDSPHFTMAQRLLKFLNYIQTADVEDEIPVHSILREFIGGSCFYRE